MQLQSYKSVNRAAYTLIEILVGLSIIGLLFGVGYVGFRDFSRRQALSGTAKKIQGDLRLAQQQAMSGKKPADSRCNSPNTLDTFSFYVYSTSSYRIEANCSGGNVTIRDTSLPAGVTISAPSVNPVKFKVLGQGTNLTSGTSTSFNITQTGTPNQATVTITDGGEIR